MRLFWDYILDHVDEVLAILFSQFLKVWFGRVLDRWMKPRSRPAT